MSQHTLTPSHPSNLGEIEAHVPLNDVTDEGVIAKGLEGGRGVTQQ